MYTGPIESLGNKTSEVEWLKGKAFIIVPPSPTDLNFVNDSKKGSFINDVTLSGFVTVLNPNIINSWI